MQKQTITIKKHADVCHRVMDHASKCRHIHGHSYLYELTFSFDSLQDIGYALDFAEIKRVGVEWIEDHLDHGAALNPQDTDFINLIRKDNSKLWLMSLNGSGNYCNPSVENIAKEVFLAMEVLFVGYSGLKISQVRIYETPNCYTDCYVDSISQVERQNFLEQNYNSIVEYRNQKGQVEYDARKL